MVPFQSLLDDHGPGLHRHLVALLGPHDGADCYQEAVIAALRAWPPAHDGNLRSWFFTVAHRKVLDHARAAGRRATPVREVPEIGTDGAVPGAEADIWDALRLLPEKQQVAVALRHGEDWAYGDIAALLDCTEVAARQSVKAGLARLKEVLA